MWPVELDLMARLAGLRLTQRSANWKKAAFAAETGKHISVYEPIDRLTGTLPLPNPACR